MTKSNDELLTEVRERLQQCIEAEHDNRAAALDDLRFLSGDQWPEQIKRARELEKRPCLTVNTLPTFLHQVTNDQRQNTPSIKVHPVDNNADKDTAEVLQGMIRHIEYSSNADIAYDTAVASAAGPGFGYFRLITEYESEDSFDQVIRFRRIRNPLSVYFDPYSQEPDGCDARFAFITDTISKDEFKRLYPKAKVTDGVTLSGLGDAGRHWMRDDGVVVAEYYRIEEVKATLCQLEDGTPAWKDELPDGAVIARERESMKRVVKWSKVTACDELESAEIPCRWIPVFPVYGSELDIEGKVLRSGLVRHAKDPARMYNFWMTSATEEVSLRPKTPFIGAEGQFEGHETEWSQANTRSFPYLEYKPTVLQGGLLAPPPQRQAMADIPAGMLQMAMHARDNIKATTGIFDASLGARGNATSGRQELAQQREGDTANFHFTDNLTRTIRHAGRCIVNMIPKVYDTQRVVRIMGEDETPEHAEINKPLPEPQQDPETGAIRTVLNDLSVGRYDVTVTAGPSYSTLRQEAAQAMVEFGQSWPKLMDIAGDKVVRAMDWPGADEIADRIERTIPPEIRDEEGQPQQLPPEVQMQLQQMQGYIQELEQRLQEASTGLEKARIDAESRERVAEINAVAKNDVEEMKGWIQLMLQKMQPPPVLTAAALQQGPASAGSSVSGVEESRAMPAEPGMGNAPQGEANLPAGDTGQEIVG